MNEPITTKNEGSVFSKMYGFNFLWMFSINNQKNISPSDISIDERELDVVAQMGCNFVRLPLDYRFWIENFNYYNPNEQMLQRVDACINAIISRGLHCSLNIHRAPGYCINGMNLEKHNLWLDEEAQKAFIHLWKEFTHRYAHVSENLLSFDLLNEPPNINQYGMTRDIHEKIMRNLVSEIRIISPNRTLVLNGLGGGNIAIPELADLNVVMSTRGYQPMALTHYKAPWCEETKGLSLPTYPDTQWDGNLWGRKQIYNHYSDWKKLSEAGIVVHVGEFGIYNKIPNSLALKWFRDIISIFNELGWGYALWNFSGDFGIANHGRVGARLEKTNNILIDKDMYDIYIKGFR